MENGETYKMCRVVCQNDQQTLQPSTSISSPGDSTVAADSTIPEDLSF